MGLWSVIPLPWALCFWSMWTSLGCCSKQKMTKTLKFWRISGHILVLWWPIWYSVFQVEKKKSQLLQASYLCTQYRNQIENYLQRFWFTVRYYSCRILNWSRLIWYDSVCNKDRINNLVLSQFNEWVGIRWQSYILYIETVTLERDCIQN